MSAPCSCPVLPALRDVHGIAQGAELLKPDSQSCMVLIKGCLSPAWLRGVAFHAEACAACLQQLLCRLD